MTFKISSSPHVRQRISTSRVMQIVLLCTLPGIAIQWWFFGWGNLIQIGIAIIAAMVAEALCLTMRRRQVIKTLSDNTAVVTGLLLGICLPPLLPWYITFMGACFAIVIAKQLYGGIGQNLFNPAMVAYVTLLISFPVQMTQWLPPTHLAETTLTFKQTLSIIFGTHDTIGLSIQQLLLGFDGSTMATPLDTLKTDITFGVTATESMSKPIFNAIAGEGWLWVNLGFALGGIILLRLKIIQWHIPFSMLASLAACSLIGFLMSPELVGSPCLHLLSGATMLGAFFIATDPVSAATSNLGRIIFGAMIGILVYLIRTYGGYPDAIAFAVMLANLSVPLIDYYTRPRTYGHGD